MLRGWLGAVVVTLVALVLVVGVVVGLSALAFISFSVPFRWSPGASVQGTHEETVLEFDGSLISVKGVNGSITVEVGRDREVLVRADYWVGEDVAGSPVLVTGSDGRLDVTVDRDLDVRGVSYVLSVPEGMDLQLATSNGRVTVEGGSGVTDIVTSNGRVSVQDRTGPVLIRTSNGEVRVGRGLVEHDIDVKTSNAAIIFSVGGEAAFDLSARTSNADVSVGLPGDWSNLSTSRWTFDGSYGGGGPTVDLVTTNGRIAVELRD